MVSGNYAYVADYWNGLRIIDITDPTNPTEGGYYDTGGSAEGVAVSGNYAYVADCWEGLRIIDISDPTNPIESGYYDTGSDAFGVAVSGNYAYVADHIDGLRIIDISDPTNPTESGYYDTGSDAYGVAVNGNHAYVADWGDGLRIIDITDPTNPTESGYYDTGSYAWGVAVSGNYAYVADWGDGLRIIDITDPTNPTESGYYDTGGSAKGVAVSGNYAYVADEGDGLRIIDISDPTSPTESGYYDTGGQARCVSVSGNYAYVADGFAGLRIIDVSDTSNPIETGFLNTGVFAFGVSVSGNYAYVAYGGDGLRIIDISDATNPTESGYYDTGYWAYGVAVRGNYAYVADGSDGLYIIRNDLEIISISLRVDSVSAYQNDTVNVAINVVFPADSTFSSAELSFGGFQGIIEFIDVVTDSSLIGTAGWTIEINENETLTIYTEAGADNISGEGVLFWLRFSVQDITSGYIPINLESAVFNPGNIPVELISGGIYILQRGDVNADGSIDVIDIVRIVNIIFNHDATDYEFWAGDYNCDNVINVLDIVKIIRVILEVPIAKQSEHINESAELVIFKSGLSIESKFAVGGIQFTIEFLSSDEDILLFNDNLPFEIYTKEDENNQFNVLMFSTIGEYVSPGEINIFKSDSRYKLADFLVSDQFGNIIPIKTIDVLSNYSLDQNYPNPFNPVTTIKYQLPQSGKVQLDVYNINGQLVENLVSEHQEAGYYSVQWDASKVGSGVYFYKIQAGNPSSGSPKGQAGHGFMDVKKCIVIK